MTEHEWFDEWGITRGGGIITISLPHTETAIKTVCFTLAEFGDPKLICRVDWLVTTLESALLALTTEVPDYGGKLPN